EGRPRRGRDGLEAEPMLIRGPHLDGFVGMLRGLFGDRVGEFFYKLLPPRRLQPAGCGDAATGSTSQSPGALPIRAAHQLGPGRVRPPSNVRPCRSSTNRHPAVAPEAEPSA